jgi:hypothetical protein
MTTHDLDRAYRAFRAERTANLRGLFDPSDSDLEELEAEAFNSAVADLLAQASMNEGREAA